jgi:hypothetical protein
MGNEDCEATPPDSYVEQALAAAGAAGGAYIETTGRTDLAAWTESEWLTLIEVIVSSFQEALRAAYGEDPPF